MADCHVELATLGAIESRLAEDGLAWLSAAEIQRLEAITAPLRRRQYLAGHWLVRGLAARHHGSATTAWQFESDARGQPHLRSGSKRLTASVSHSGEFVAVAIATQPIGLDLEYPGRPRDLHALARFAFSPEECQALEQAPPAQQAQRFLSTWSLKEAFGKRNGEGLQPSRARSMLARETAPASAEAWLWNLPGQAVLALAAWPGAQVKVHAPEGLPAPSTWRYENLPA